MILVPDGYIFMKNPKSNPYEIFYFNFAQGFFVLFCFLTIREVSITSLLKVCDFEISEFWP